MIEPDRSPRFQRLDLYLMFLIFTVALTLRLVYVYQLQSSPLFDSPSMDEKYHDDWAQAIAKGETFVEGPYFRAPLYPALLGILYKIVGPCYLAPRIIQAIIGSVSCILVFLIGRLVFHRWIGAVAGLVCSTYWMLIYFDGELLIPTLIVFLDLLLIFLLLVFTRIKSTHSYAMLGVGLGSGLRIGSWVGLVLGLSAIARPNVLLFAPFIVFWILYQYRTSLNRALRYVGVVTAGCLLVVIPITVRNYVVGGDTVLISSQGGVNFYIGNNPRSDGRTAIVPGTPGGWWEGYHATIRRAEQASGHKLKSSEVSQYYYQEAFQFIRDEPGAFLSLMGHKLRLFWSRWEIPNNKGIYFWSDQFTPILGWLPLGFAVMAPLGLMGVITCRKRAAELFPLWGFVIIYMLGVILFFCTARYRMPIIPPLVLLGTYGLFELVKDVREKKWSSVSASIVALCVGAALVNIDPVTTPFRNDALSHTSIGAAYLRKKQPGLAEEHFRQALQAQPDYVTARFNLGEIFRKSNRPQQAIEQFHRALNSKTRLSGETNEITSLVHFSLASAYQKKNDAKSAAKHFRACIELDPNVYPGRVQFNLAMMLQQAGDREAAKKAFANAIDPLIDQVTHHPKNQQLLHALRVCCFTQDQYEKAVSYLEKKIAVKQADYISSYDLIDAFILTRRYAEAIKALEANLDTRYSHQTSRLAMLLASCPDDLLRDGRRALALMSTLCPHALKDNIHADLVAPWKLIDCTARSLDSLAISLAETGQFEKAITITRIALKIERENSAKPRISFTMGLLQRMELYQTGKPYRMP